MHSTMGSGFKVN